MFFLCACYMKTLMKAWFSRKGKGIGRLHISSTLQLPEFWGSSHMLLYTVLRSTTSTWERSQVSATWELMLWMLHFSVYEQHIIHALVPFDCFQDKFSYGNCPQLIPGSGLISHDKENQSEHQIRKTIPAKQSKTFKHALIQSFHR